MRQTRGHHEAAVTLAQALPAIVTVAAPIAAVTWLRIKEAIGRKGRP